MKVSGEALDLFSPPDGCISGPIINKLCDKIKNTMAAKKKTAKKTVKKTAKKR